ncbi:unnamed protein product [Rotaria magnacalcarata]|uniref:Uncharacterized protein n=1 Tax=Rotaria magnacalcarata TaxID=392030 RepID=A0A819YLM0_9BILA|nr:unnamed protein product [Rotaria magnacalcarata]
MDFWIVEYWSLAFTVIVSFLGGLTYFIQRQFLTKKSQILEVMNQQGRHGSASSRRKNPRNANKRKQQTTNSNSNSNDIKEEEQKENSSELTLENDVQERQSVLEQPIQQTQEKQEEEKIQNNSQIEQNVSPPTHVEDEQEPTTQVKQRNKMKPINKSPSLSSSRQEVFVPSKPQASVAPVKQAYLSSPIKNSSNHMNSSRDIYPKSNGNVSPSHNIYTYSAYNSLPPRFQQQILQKEAASAARRYRKRRGPLPSKRSSLPPGSAARSNEFIPSSFQEQQELEHEQQQIDDTQIELSMSIPQQPESLMINGYSSESDFLTGKIHYFV